MNFNEITEANELKKEILELNNAIYRINKVPYRFSVFLKESGRFTSKTKYKIPLSTLKRVFDEEISDKMKRLKELGVELDETALKNKPDV